MSEPPFSDANRTFFYIDIYIYVCVCHTSYPKLIQFNARNVYRIRIVQTSRVLQWSRTAILQQESPSHQGVEKTDCSIEESERELVVPLKPQNREEWLRVRRARDRARLAAQTAEERDARLQQIRDNRRQSLATESEEERAVRLQQMRDGLASETEEERAVKLQRMSANQHHRLASETEEERAAKLQQMSVFGL